MPFKSREAAKLYFKSYHQRNHEKRLEGARRQRQTERYKQLQPLRSRRSMLRIRYGITPDDYDRMFSAQMGCCAICQTAYPNNGKGNKYLDVDHDATTGRVRGLLCRQCNVMLGQLEKIFRRPALSSAVQAYLGVHVEYQPL